MKRKSNKKQEELTEGNAEQVRNYEKEEEEENNG